MGTGSLVRR